MNVSLICLTLKYLRTNYKLISCTCKWIYFELSKMNFSESKFIKALEKENLEIIKDLIKFNENKDILDKYLANFSERLKICEQINKLVGEPDYITLHIKKHINIIKLLEENRIS